MLKEPVSVRSLHLSCNEPAQYRWLRVYMHEDVHASFERLYEFAKIYYWTFIHKNAHQRLHIIGYHCTHSFWLCYIGHRKLTHSFMLKLKEQPQLIGCQTANPVKYFLIECKTLTFIRQRFFNINSTWKCQYGWYFLLGRNKIMPKIIEVNMINAIQSSY